MKEYHSSKSWPFMSPQVLHTMPEPLLAVMQKCTSMHSQLLRRYCTPRCEYVEKSVYGAMTSEMGNGQSPSGCNYTAGSTNACPSGILYSVDV